MSYWPDKPRILLSYAYLNGPLAEVSMDGRDLSGVDFLIDSGAFTAYTLGKQINLTEYMDWLTANRRLINHAAALDVIGDWKGSAANFDIMQEAIGDKVHVIPAWHLGSPLEELARLCKTNPYVAIGGCVPYAKTPKLLMRHLIQAHKVAREYGTGLHGLGITGKVTMTALPWKSTDSSSWVSGHRFGQVVLTDRRGQNVDLPFGKPLSKEQAATVRAYGGSPSRFQDSNFGLIGKIGKEQGEKDRAWIASSAARSIMHQEGLLRTKHGTEFNCYLASSPGQYNDWAIDGHRLGSPFH